MSDRLKVTQIRDETPREESGSGESTGIAAAATEGLSPDQAGPGRRITLHFSLTLVDGSEIDSNFGGRPAVLVFGDGNLPAAFESCLLGLRAGDRQVFHLPPERAFGQPNPDNVQRYPRYQFPADLPLEPGLMVSFTDSAGNEQAGVVLETDSRTVEVDFNHPLAGREVCFTVEIMAVEAA